MEFDNHQLDAVEAYLNGRLTAVRFAASSLGMELDRIGDMDLSGRARDVLVASRSARLEALRLDARLMENDLRELNEARVPEEAEDPNNVEVVINIDRTLIDPEEAEKVINKAMAKRFGPGND